MRTGYNNEFLLSETGEFLGVNLGADHVAEHEWGIKATQRAFGMNSGAMGVDRYTITKMPNLLKLFSSKNFAALVMNEYAFTELTFDDVVGQIGAGLPKDSSKIATAWSDGAFGILVCDEDKIGHLALLHQAILNLDVCIWLGGGGPFQNAGLCIAIKSRLSDETKDNWLKAHVAQAKLTEEFNATGIEKFLKDAGKKWYYLGPKRNQMGEMIIWLNPMEQHKYESGYFTVEQLKQWAKDKGPVVRKVPRNS